MTQKVYQVEIVIVQLKAADKRTYYYKASNIPSIFHSTMHSQIYFVLKLLTSFLATTTNCGGIERAPSDTYYMNVIVVKYMHCSSVWEKFTTWW